MMTSSHEDTAALPLRRDLMLVHAASLMVAVLMATASTIGILFRSGIYPTDSLLESFLPNDVANLLIGLPMLLVSMWFARRGRLAGLLLWMGAVFFVLYGYIVYVLAMPLNAVYAMYFALVLLSSYALVGLVTSIDRQAVRQRLIGAVHERLAGGVLSGLGFLFFVLAFSSMASALVSKAPIVRSEFALHIADCVISPVWVVCGVLLWQRKEFGYVAGLGLLFQASMLFVGLIIVLLLLPLLTTAPFSVGDVVVILIMGLICFVPLGLFLRGVISSRSSSATA